MDKEQVPQASTPEDIWIGKPGSFMTLVSVNMPLVRAEMDLKYNKKTVTLLKWLNGLAEEANINFSSPTAVLLLTGFDSFIFSGWRKDSTSFFKGVLEGASNNCR